jgi:spoIIIJ-associated protein
MKAPIETEGSTIDEAIDHALATLGAKREDVRVEILNDARKGLLGFGGQPARVRVSPRAAAVAGDGASRTDAERDRAAAERPTSSSADAGPATEIVAKLLELMDFPAELSSEVEPEGRLRIRIATESGGLLIGKHGQTLDSLEYLVNRLLGRHEDGGQVSLDAEDYRERRRQSLEQMARNLADRAKKRGRAETLMPMSPRDRRVIHLALRDDPAVTTKSLGEGHLRRVVISPAGARPRARGTGGRPPVD